MNLHEYQAKQIFAEYGIAVPVGKVARTADEAVAAAKALIPHVAGLTIENAMPVTAAAIATRRVSAEGQDGLRAFLDKRSPSWSG